MDDTQLLRTYLETGSEQAFAAVVDRHIPLVYSAALRQCNGDARRAEEVTQMVFTDLAQKAEHLKNHPLLVGWLHRSTRWASNKLRRGDERRRNQEKAFALETELLAQRETPVDWEQIRPWIDEALDELGESDRQAVILRFFENLSFDEIGGNLGITENTARMRVSRALDKLHASLSSKGLRSSSAALGLALGAHSVSAVPPGLSSSIAKGSFAQAAASSGATLAGSIFLMTKFQAGLLGVLALGLGLGAFLSYKDARALAADELALQARLAGLKQQIADAEAAKTKTNATLVELKAKTPPPPTPTLAERFKLDKIIRKGELDQDYGFLFKKLRLSREKVDALKGLLVDRNQAIFDARKIVESSGVGELLPTEQQTIASEASVEVDERIRELLGDAGLAYLRFYLESSGWRRTQLYLDGFQTADLPDLEKMEQIDVRAAKLMDLVKVECPSYIDEAFWNYKPPRLLPEIVEVRIAEILGPKYRDQQLLTKEYAEVRQKMDAIARIAAAEGKLMLTKSSARAYGVPHKTRAPRRPATQTQ